MNGSWSSTKLPNYFTFSGDELWSRFSVFTAGCVFCFICAATWLLESLEDCFLDRLLLEVLLPFRYTLLAAPCLRFYLTLASFVLYVFILLIRFVLGLSSDKLSCFEFKDGVDENEEDDSASDFLLLASLSLSCRAVDLFSWSCCLSGDWLLVIVLLLFEGVALCSFWFLVWDFFPKPKNVFFFCGVFDVGLAWSFLISGPLGGLLALSFFSADVGGTPVFLAWFGSSDWLL